MRNIWIDANFRDMRERAHLVPGEDLLCPGKRKKKVNDRRIRLKLELWWILNEDDICYLGSKCWIKWKNYKLTELESSYNSYTQELKEQISIPYIQEIEQRWLIWERVVDRGSGFNPLSIHLKGQHQCIEVDIIWEEWENKVRFDLEKVTPEDSFHMYTFRQKLASMLEIHDSNNSIDFMIFSEILNYVNTKKFLLGTNKLLKVGWSILIINEPHRWIHTNLHHYRIWNNQALISFLTKIWYEVQELYFVEWQSMTYGGIFSQCTYQMIDNVSQGDVAARNNLCMILANKK